jgi:hypothetical protein
LSHPSLDNLDHLNDCVPGDLKPLESVGSFFSKAASWLGVIRFDVLFGSTDDGEDMSFLLYMQLMLIPSKSDADSTSMMHPQL